VAIGAATAAEAIRLGFTVSGEATESTVGSIADAVAAAVLAPAAVR
jgi:uroporphyrinogen-III synthase